MPRRRFFLNLLQRYPLRSALTIVLGFSGAFFNGISTALIVPVIFSLLGQDLDVGNAPPLIRALLAPFETIPPRYRLVMMAGVVVLAIALKNATLYLSTVMSSALKQRVTSDMREHAIRLLLDVDLDYFHKLGVGDILNRVNHEIGRAANALSAALRVITNGATIFVFVGLLVAMSWQLTTVASGLLFLVVLLNQFFIARSKTFGKNLSETSKGYSMRLAESLAGMRLIKEVASEEREYDTLSRLIRQRENIELQAQVNTAAIAPVSEMAGIIALIGIVLFGRLFFADQLTTLATVLLTYLVVLFRMLPVLSQLNSARSLFANHSASVDIVSEFLRRDNKPFMANGTQPFRGIQHAITFEDVSFTYPGSDRPSLEHISLTLQRGQTLALVGASGAGKSTLADLLPRFYDPTCGCIKIDGDDLKSFDLTSLRQSIGVVSQESFLFNDSVRNNVAYARPDATDDEVVHALHKANAYEFVSKLPKGMETQIGDRGVMLSGGQRQRLSIARALLKNAPILILDEATSALDTVSEKLVQTAIDELNRDRTSIVIAHRLSTIRNADQIAVLDKGQVVELGTHEELLAQGNYYAKLCEMQFSSNPSTPTHRSHPSSTRTALTQTSMRHTSHSMRDRLNSALGALSLLADHLEGTSEEGSALIKEAYDSSVSVLQSLESMEKQILPHV
ncbi:MAG: ABC transporter ATP-binding protein [Leptolyngbyaceae bacterium]|nr:ABC transporter ATP-binding protein [Leptolyngbyaceae bacterium]